MKRGISLLVLMITVLIMSILAGVGVFYGNDIVKMVNKSKFNIEILNIQNEVDNYYIENKSYPIKENIEFDISNLGVFEINQFVNEERVNNKITIAKLDLSELGINNTIFGNNTTDTDAYVVSEKTGRVYYLNGISYRGQKYFISDNMLTEDNFDEAHSNVKNDIRIKDVIFRVSEVNDVSYAVSVLVMLPNKAILNSVVTTNEIDVGNISFNKKYNMVEVNKNKVKGNYDITVTYTLNNVQNTVVYNVNNSDIQGPVIEASMEKFKNYTIININSIDNGEHVSAKYEFGDISDASYFDKYGKIVINNKIVCYEAGVYTIFAVDKLGNTTLLKQTVDMSEEE